MAFWSKPKSTDVESADAALLREAFRYALSLSARHHTAQDLVQQAAYKLFRRYGGLKNRSLVFTAVRNLFFDQKRRESTLPHDSLEEMAEGDAHGLLPYVAPTQDGRHLDIAELLSHLSAEERELMFLHYVSGYTAAEMAALTGRPRNTILSQLARARKKVKPDSATTAQKGQGQA